MNNPPSFVRGLHLNHFEMHRIPGSVPFCCHSGLIVFKTWGMTWIVQRLAAGLYPNANESYY